MASNNNILLVYISYYNYIYLYLLYDSYRVEIEWIRKEWTWERLHITYNVFSIYNIYFVPFHLYKYTSYICAMN